MLESDYFSHCSMIPFWRSHVNISSSKLGPPFSHTEAVPPARKDVHLSSVEPCLLPQLVVEELHHGRVHVGSDPAG
jgi:hypothetical protein